MVLIYQIQIKTRVKLWIIKSIHIFSGFGTSATGGLFGGAAAAAPATGGLFGSQPAQQTGGLFSGGSTSFGGAGAMAGQSGSVVKFVAPAGNDTVTKSGVTQNISTQHHCITAMKEYDGKSFEVSFYMWKHLLVVESFNLLHSV